MTVDGPRRVLVIDDDAQLRHLLRATLDSEFEVLEAESGRDGLRAFYSERPDLVILDALMPEMDGWEVLRRIRDLADTPIIMLTALTGEQDVVRSLESGADEYVTKPFSPAALAARIRAVLRRSGTAPVQESTRLALDSGNLVIDREAGRVWVRGREVSLSATEYRLLVFLAGNLNRVVPSERILEHVWGPSYRAENEYVKNYIRLLRAKIEADPRRPRYVLSRRGLGYVLVADPDE